MSLNQSKGLPYINIVMMSSFDGQARGKYFFYPGGPINALIEFIKELRKMPHQGEIFGSSTIKEACNLDNIDLSKYQKNNISIPKEDWISPNKLDNCCFTFDRRGSLNYKTCNCDLFDYMKCPEKIGVVESHMVSILLENVSNEYLQFLREKKVSYFFAGKDAFDFELALKKMKTLFKVETVILGGGPTINEQFYQRDLFDEVNLLLMPCSGSGEDRTGIFGNGKFVEFDLVDVKRIEGGNLFLKYKKKNKV